MSTEEVKPITRSKVNRSHTQSKGSEEGSTLSTSLGEAIAAALEMKDAILEKKPITAWKHSRKIQDYLIEQAEGLGLQSVEALSDDECEQVNELQKILKECKTLVGKFPKKSKEPEMQAIGDGTLLKKMLDFLIAILPILIGR